MRLATQIEKFQFLGPPGDTSQLAKVSLPFKMQLSWKLGYSINSFQANRIIVPHLEAIYNDLNQLSFNYLVKAGIPIFGGCYAFRPIRGTEMKEAPPFSAHSWGIAVDHDPVNNGLRMKADRANLAKKEFQAIHLIFAKYGFLNMGHVIGRDYMHYEASFELLQNPQNFI